MQGVDLIKDATRHNADSANSQCPVTRLIRSWQGRLGNGLAISVHNSSAPHKLYFEVILS
jgi:hypothetical protein